MEFNNYPITLWCDGEIVVDGENVSYKDGYENFICVSSSISFNELENQIYDVLEVDRTKFRVSLKMKFPSGRGYRVSRLSNDRALKALFASVCHFKIHGVELYVDLVGLEPSSFEIGQTSLLNPNLSSLVESGVEVEEEVIVEDEDEDALLVLDVDDGSQFYKLTPVDEQFLTTWDTTNVASFGRVDEFCAGQTFRNKKELKWDVTRYHLKNSKVFRNNESKTYTVTYICGMKSNPCDWYLRATQKSFGNPMFTIVTYKGPHSESCCFDKPSMDHPNLTSSFISIAIEHLVKADWGVKVDMLRASIKNSFSYTIPYAKAWNAKQKAISKLFGDWETSYQYLTRYLEALKKVNPGTEYLFENTPTNDPNIEQFNRVFWAFGPSIRGFKHCRPVITIDGTHLYGKYKGVLLIAMGVDANGQIFPLAFAIVYQEDYDNWSWFLACIRRFVTDRQGLCVISDRHRGILKALRDKDGGWNEPHAYHRYCIRHHASNINTKFKDKQLKKAFLRAAKTHDEYEWEQEMLTIGELNENAKTELEAIPYAKWCLLHDGGKRYGITTSNLCEIFNGVLKSVRFLPIQTLVKATFTRLVMYFADRREIARNLIAKEIFWTKLVSDPLSENVSLAGNYEVEIFNRYEGKCQVITNFGPCWVDLELRTCTCSKWQNLHYPCSHLVAVCQKLNIPFANYIDPGYSTVEYFNSYKLNFFPVLDENLWKQPMGITLVPDPSRKRGFGRPKSKRLLNEMDEGSKSKVKCSLCGGVGHNKRTCSLRPSG